MKNGLGASIGCLALAALIACSRTEEPRSSTGPSRLQVKDESRRDVHPAGASLSPTTAPPTAAPCSLKPNILLITLDTLRYDATELDSASGNSTPFLRQLAASGVNFRNCYSTHDATPQSHFSLFTGYVNGLQTQLDRQEASIAYQLEKIGYDSFAVVANGNLSQRAFSTAIPFRHCTNLHDEWMSMTEEQKNVLSPALDARLQVYGAPSTDFNRMLLYGSGERVLRRLGPRMTGARPPFVGFVNLLDSHDPYVPDPRYYRRAKEKRLRADPPPPIRDRTLSEELEHPEAIADPARRDFIESKIQQAGGRSWSVATDLDRPSLKIYRMRYDAEVRELDRFVSRIFEMLDENHLRQSTIVVITSDHGESFGEQQFITHSFADQGDRESTHHVPLLIVFPPCYRVASSTIRNVCSIADITPTFYDLLRIDASPLWKLAPPGEYGHSLLAEIEQRKHDDAPHIAATVQNRRVTTPEEQRRLDEESIKRLRALGYLH